jgi:competence protein ComEC
MQEIIYNLKNKIRFLYHNFGRIILIIFLILIFLFTIYFYNNYYIIGDLKILFFDIGQGDSLMIETPSHKKIIIDAGPSDKVLGLVDNEMNLFDRDIDLAIMSHPDQDHIAGFISLFKKYNFQKII